MVQLGSGAQRSVPDFRLTRFGAYLVAMAGDDTKQAVAEARIYFAVRTREAEQQAVRREPTQLEIARSYVAVLEEREALEAANLRCS